MLEKFSASYRISYAYIEPIETLNRNGNTSPRLSENQYTVIAKWYDKYGVKGHPIFRLGNSHFPVIGDTDLPEDTLKVPREIIPDDFKPPSRDRYLVMKPNAQKIMTQIMDPEKITSGVDYY